MGLIIRKDQLHECCSKVKSRVTISISAQVNLVSMYWTH